MKYFNELICGIAPRADPQPAPDIPKDEEEVIKSTFKIRKSDDEKRQVFGWASVSITEDGQQVEDWQSDEIDPEDLENAAYYFVQFYRDGGEMHQKLGVGRLIESMVFTKEKLDALGIPEGTIPVGWWVGFQITDEEVWKKVKSGEYTMFSIEGTAIRVDADDDDQSAEEAS